MNTNKSIDQLAVSLGATLQAKKWTVSCAESCTGGGVAYAITSVAGSSAWFERAFVTYSNPAKHSMLGVDEKILESYGAVSKQTVENMAKGCALASGANVAIAVSGIAGPDGGTVDKPVGLVWFGFYIQGNLYAVQCNLPGDRKQVREQAIKYALAKTLSLIEPLI